MPFKANPPAVPNANGKVSLIGDSGWIKVGTLYCGLGPCTENPESDDLYGRSDMSMSAMQIGDTIRLKTDLRVYINDFLHKGITNIKLPPHQKDEPLSDDSMTNITLNAGNEMMIRDIQRILSGSYTNRRKEYYKVYEVWLRVSYIQ